MWSRIVTFLQRFFAVSPKEARGMLVLVFLSALLLIFPFFLKHHLFVRSAAEVESERRFLDSLMQAWANSHLPARSGSESPKPAEVPAVLRPFDPNLASEDELAGLGIPVFLARRIVNYRQKGGVFRQKEDLRRIYDFPASLYQALEPYITLNEVDKGKGGRWESGNSPRDAPLYSPVVVPDAAGSAQTRESREPATAQLVPFDINKADTVLLKKLRGIGSGRARIIVNYRNALGGFYAQSQYDELFGMDSTALSQLHTYAQVLSPPDKIEINTITLEELLKHPYARKNRKYAEAIIRYRLQHGAYQSRDDLAKVIAVPASFITLLDPYLAY